MTSPDSIRNKAATVGHPVFHCQGVTKRFDEAVAVDDTTLTLEPGEIMALVGPSGCGKTTLLRLIAGFDSPDSGTISLNGQVMAGPGRWVPPEARRVGMVFQDYALFPHLNVLQNVAYGLKGWAEKDRCRRIKEVLEIVRLAGFEKRHPHQLSGGEQQRVALARSLAPHPLALLLDEPFSNLDPHLRWQLRAEVRNILHSSDVSAIYVTHDQEEALFLGDKVAVMHRGKVLQVSGPEEVFHHPRTQFVGGYMGIAHFIQARTAKDGIITEIGLLKPHISLPDGMKVRVMVRPDDVAIYPSDGGLGRVLYQVFQGTHYLYAISLPSGEVVHSLQHHSIRYQQGEAVDVSFGDNQAFTCFVDLSEPPLESGWSFSAATV